MTAERPVLVDRFLEDAVEVDVDAVRDGTGEILIAGVMEHVEEAGVHSGDSACALPPQSLDGDVLATIERHTRALAEALGVRGLINVQYAVKDGQVYVLEANPRASRTVPFVAKATGVPLAMVASRVMVGQTLAELRAEGLLPPDAVERVRVLDHVSVKEAVLPFDRFPGVDTLLGPRCARPARSWVSTSPSAWPSPRARWPRAPGCPTRALCSSPSPTATSRPDWRSRAPSVASVSPSPPRSGTAGFLRSAGLVVDTLVAKVGEEGVASDAVDLIAQGKVQLVVNTPRGLGPRADGAAHPHGLGHLPGAVPHDARRGARRRRRDRRRAGAPARGANPAGSASRFAGRRGERARRRARPGRSRRRPVDRGRRGRAAESDHDRVGDVGPRDRARRLRRARRARRGRGQVAVASTRGRAIRRRGCTRSVRACSTASGCRARDWPRGSRRTCPRSAAAGARVVVSIWGSSRGATTPAPPRSWQRRQRRSAARARRARGQRELPQRRRPLPDVRPLGGGDVERPGGHRMRAAALGQAQPERARRRGDRRRRRRGRRGRPDAGQHAAGPGPRPRVRPPGARRRRRRPLGRRSPPGRGPGGLGVPGGLPRHGPSSAWVGSPAGATRSSCSRPAPTPCRSERPRSATPGRRGRCCASSPAGARRTARPSASCGRRPG